MYFIWNVTHGNPSTLEQRGFLLQREAAGGAGPGGPPLHWSSWLSLHSCHLWRLESSIYDFSLQIWTFDKFVKYKGEYESSDGLGVILRGCLPAMGGECPPRGSGNTGSNVLKGERASCSRSASPALNCCCCCCSCSCLASSRINWIIHSLNF